MKEEQNDFVYRLFGPVKRTVVNIFAFRGRKRGRRLIRFPRTLGGPFERGVL